MISIGDAEIIKVLQEILATLKRIEEQGKPEVSNIVFKIDASKGLDEETIAQVAERKIYWELLRSNNGHAEKEEVKPVDPTFMNEAVQALEDAPTGKPVYFGTPKAEKRCSGCDECCDD